MMKKLAGLMAVLAAGAVQSSGTAVAEENVFRREVKQGGAKTWVAKLKTRDAMAQEMKKLPSMRMLAEQRPQSCRLFLKRSNEEDELVLALPHKELAQGMDIIDGLFRSVDDKNAFRGRWEEASMMALQYIAQALPQRDRDILFNGGDAGASDREICDSVATMYDTIAAMPLQERAVVMRLLNRKVS